MKFHARLESQQFLTQGFESWLTAVLRLHRWRIPMRQFQCELANGVILVEFKSAGDEIIPVPHVTGICKEIPNRLNYVLTFGFTARAWHT
jgi:hypothetical protein